MRDPQGWDPMTNPQGASGASGNNHGPYAKAVRKYRQAGWDGVLPLPAREKNDPPAGYTGARGIDPTDDTIREWLKQSHFANGNICLRMPDGVVGIDVDHYDGKQGGNDLAVLEALVGVSLPPTIMSSSRDDGTSAIRFYRVPKGLKWPGNVGKSIEIIQKRHRYAVVAPSIHPEGREYRWLSSDWSPFHPDDVPEQRDLSGLPDEYVQHFTGGEVGTGPADLRDNITIDEVDGILTAGEPCRAIRNALSKYEERKQTEARHDAMKNTVLALVRVGEFGHQGAATALDELREQFYADLNGERYGKEQGEFQRALVGSVTLVLSQPTQGDKRCCGTRPRTDPEAPADLDVTNAAEAATWLREELGRSELSGVFLREGELSHTPRIGEDGYLPAEKLGLRDAGPAQVRVLLNAGIKALIEGRYNLTRWVGRGDDRTQVPALFPTQSVNSACDAARIGEHMPNLRSLHGVTHTPTIRPDGTILDQPGYDEETGLLYLPDDSVDFPPISDDPTGWELTQAMRLIQEPIAEFPFVSEDDRATWIGLAFTPALRPLLPPPFQMGVITATNPGSGKTLLTNMLMTLHGGVQRGEMPRDDNELRKSITAALMDTTAPIVVFDNLAGTVKSPVLDSLLTTRTWTDRWLGQNKSVTAPNDRLWLATGNNAQFGGDLGRRIAMVKLDPPNAGHHLRTDFAIENLHGWMEAHRGDYIAALLTIARGWVIAGSPADKARSDGFAQWISGIRGLLEWIGFAGRFGGSFDAEAMTEEDEEWHVFLMALYDRFGSLTITVKDIAHELKKYDVDAMAFATTGGLDMLDPASW
jgi:hypothetical protein